MYGSFLANTTCLNLFSVLVMIISIHLLGVDLTLWAHEHSYERLWPMYDMQVSYLNSSSVSPQIKYHRSHSFLSFCCRFAMGLWKSHIQTPVHQFISSLGQRYVDSQMQSPRPSYTVSGTRGNPSPRATLSSVYM